MPDLSTLVEAAMMDLRGWVEAGMEQRGKNATGETMASVQVSVTTAPDHVTGSLSALSTWRYVGSGRGPGRMPPVDNLQAWIEARGLDLDAWAVARSIALHGTDDFRRKNTNVFLDAIEAWERLDLSRYDEEFARNLEDHVVEITVGILRN